MSDQGQSGELLESEEAIIRHFAPLAAAAAGAFALQDDCALLAPPAGCELVLKTDPIAEGVHFLVGEEPQDVGWKALAVNVSDLAAKIACQVPRGDGSDGSFNADQWMEPKEQRKVDDFIIFAMGAATQALADAGWKPESRDDQNQTGVLIGTPAARISRSSTRLRYAKPGSGTSGR